MSALNGYFTMGGPVMYPLGLCSVLILAIALERLFMLRRQRVLPAAFCLEVEDLLKEMRVPEAAMLCKANGSSLARVLYAGLTSPLQTWEMRKETVESIGRQECHLLEARLGFLSALTGASPLLGLLGTVTGLLRVFQTIEAAGTGNTALFASGIYEALITTVFGLGIAIPGFLIFKFLERRVEELVVEMEVKTLRILALVPPSAQ